MSQINSIMSTRFTTSGSLRQIQSQQNTKVNGGLFDFKFTPDSTYLAGDKFSILKNCFVDLLLRQGGNPSGGGGSELIIDSVPLYQILQYSDCIAGVSVNATQMTAGSEWRISGYLPFGFFGLGARDSLDLEVYCGSAPALDFDLTVSTVYNKDQLSLIRKYQTAKPTGSDQSYTNVVSAFIDTATPLAKSVTIRDEVNDNSTINIEDAIAYTNAVGNFEVFTRFGQLYEDVYGVGQNLTMKCPTDNADTEILLVSYLYNKNFLVSSADNFTANKDLLYTKIRNQGGDKADYLSAIGLL